MTTRLFSGAVIGLDAFPIEVEVDATPGLHLFAIVGLPDKAVEESRDRIQAALRNSHFIAPKQKNQRITVNLAPADVKKGGSGYDLPMALGYLITTKQLTFEPKKKMFFGELGLDGTVRRMSGILLLVSMAKDLGFHEIYVPVDNAQEASLISGITIFAVSSLIEIANHLSGKAKLSPLLYKSIAHRTVLLEESEISIADIRGQESAKRALIVAASGGHNVLMHGPPGSGKTILAKALSGILPPLSEEESLELTRIYSVAGLTTTAPIIIARPFRNPHHTTSAVAIIGGGSWPRPGEVTLAHRGVLFLDEFPEFPRAVSEALRQPMESGDVVIARANTSVRFPARFILVAAMNPCQCGNYGSEDLVCTCTEQSVKRYQRRISGPILDRIDIQIIVPRETYAKLSDKKSTDISSNSKYSDQIFDARLRQRKRYSIDNKYLLNSELGPKDVHVFCPLSTSAEQLIEKAVTANSLSARAYHKLLKLARTIADL